MKLTINPRQDKIVGGQIFTADDKGEVEIPDELAKAEGLLKDQAKEQADPEREALVDEASEIQILDPKTGKPIAPSVLKRWDIERLKSAIEARKVELAKLPVERAGGANNEQSQRSASPPNPQQ